MVSWNEDGRMKRQEEDEGHSVFAAKVLAMEHGPVPNAAGQKSWAEMEISPSILPQFDAATFRRHSARFACFSNRTTAMAVTLGKRKRTEVQRRVERDEGDSDDERVRQMFQRAFEAKFKPLKKHTASTSIEVSDQSASEVGDEASDWDGLSDGDNGVEIVDYGSAGAENDRVHSWEMKEYMSSKPPSSDTIGRRRPKQSVTVGKNGDEAAESVNLQHDLALQRLLKESHLLDPSTFNGSKTAPEGKGRLKALDMRLLDLGAKRSISEQKMPIAHRKGIQAKAASREITRRKEATENGVILERPKATAKAMKPRDRGIGAPSVGRFRGGTLKLSARDVKSIEGPKQRLGKGRRR